LKNLDEISALINQLSLDLKAETLVAALLEGGYSLKDFLVSNDGQLQRVWGKDIRFAEISKLDTGDQQVCLHLNRDGIYDTLPESLFHSNIEKDYTSGKEMAKDSQKLKIEEKEIRSFFQPVENEMFYQRVKGCAKENELMKSVISQLLMGLIPGFWNLPDDLPAAYTGLLVKLLPLAHRIAGNPELAAKSLEFILQEKTEIFSCKNEPAFIPKKAFSDPGVIGDAVLGENLVCGDQATDCPEKFVVRIGPFRLHQTGEMAKDGTLDRFLECFYGNFMPMEAGVETRFIFNSEDSMFFIEDPEKGKRSFLGYNSVL
jgi:hypothetical protein